MGYFANGTEGDLFESENCNRCVHENAKNGCPVMMAHVLFSYDLCNKQDDPGKVILDMLIPRDGAYNAKCAMLAPKPKSVQEKLEARLAELRADEAARTKKAT